MAHTDGILIYLFASFVGFVVLIVITRAIFSIPKIIRYQKALIKLAALNAEKSGAEENLIKEIVFEADEAFKNDPHFKE